MENKDYTFLDHYTYGLHPQELGYGIKAYSNERIGKYQNILEKTVNSVNFSDMDKEEEINILYISKDEVILSLITPNGVDASKRKGIFSHSIVIDKQVYIQLGARPGIFESYFIRNIDLKGKVDKIKVIPPLEYKIPEIGILININTLKNILSTLIKVQGVIVICKDRTLTTKLPYFFLEFLPPSERLISYITSFPKKNLSNSFKLIITREEPYIYEKGWRIFDINKTKDFLPNDYVDKVIDIMVDSYFRGGLQEYHELWHKFKHKNPDIESCARIFLYETRIKDEGILPFLEETIKKPSYDNDIKERCDILIEKIREIPLSESERLEKFLSLCKTKLSASKEKIEEELRKIMIKTTSIFSKEERLKIIDVLGREFPSYKNIIYSDLERDFGKELYKYIERYPDMIEGLDEYKKIEYIDTLPLNEKLKQYYNYIQQTNTDKIMEMIDKEYKSSLMYKSLLASYGYVKSEDHDKEIDEKVKFIVKKLVDTLDKTITRGNFSTRLIHKISIQTIIQLFLSKAIFILLYCLKHFNLNEDVKKLERIARDYISIMFSLDKKFFDELQKKKS